MNFEGAGFLALVLWLAFGPRCNPLAHPSPAEVSRLDLRRLCSVVLIAFWPASDWICLDDFCDVWWARKDVRAPSAWLAATFYRPLGSFSSWERTWAGLNPVSWHVAGSGDPHSNSILMSFWRGTEHFAFQLGRAQLFAVHGTRPEVAIWVAGRFDLIATALRWRLLFGHARLFLWSLLAVTLGCLQGIDLRRSRDDSDSSHRAGLASTHCATCLFFVVLRSSSLPVASTPGIGGTEPPRASPTSSRVRAETY